MKLEVPRAGPFDDRTAGLATESCTDAQYRAQGKRTNYQGSQNARQPQRRVWRPCPDPRPHTLNLQLGRRWLVSSIRPSQCGAASPTVRPREHRLLEPCRIGDAVAVLSACTQHRINRPANGPFFVSIVGVDFPCSFALSVAITG